MRQISTNLRIYLVTSLPKNKLQTCCKARCTPGCLEQLLESSSVTQGNWHLYGQVLSSSISILSPRPFCSTTNIAFFFLYALSYFAFSYPTLDYFEISASVHSFFNKEKEKFKGIFSKSTSVYFKLGYCALSLLLGFNFEFGFDLDITGLILILTGPWIELYLTWMP